MSSIGVNWSSGAHWCCWRSSLAIWHSPSYSLDSRGTSLLSCTFRDWKSCSHTSQLQWQLWLVPACTRGPLVFQTCVVHLDGLCVAWQAVIATWVLIAFPTSLLCWSVIIIQSEFLKTPLNERRVQMFVEIGEHYEHDSHFLRRAFLFCCGRDESTRDAATPAPRPVTEVIIDKT